MAIFTIAQGEHRAKPTSFGLWKKKKSIERKVKFTDSCNYTLAGEDKEDISKLFGLGFCTGADIFSVIRGMFNQKHIPDTFHHTDSARFGWFFDSETKQVRLFAYCYINGARASQEICSVGLNEEVKCRIEMSNKTYTFTVFKKDTFHTITANYTHSKKWAYLLNLYFGGNQPAPHEIKVEIKK